MDKERFTKDAKYKAFILALHYWQIQEAKLEKDVKEMVESFKSEFDLQLFIKNFSNSDNKNLLIFRFTEEYINNMEYINYIINNYEKEDKKLTKKLILFIVHKRRHILNKKEEKVDKSKNDAISFIDDEFNQIFIDNLQGKEEK